MRTFAAGMLQRGPRRSQLGNAARPYRRGELAAGLSAIALITELLLVPAAVPVSFLLFAVGRASRWRPEWLLLPLLTGVGWLVAAGPRWIVAAVAARPGELLSGLAHAAADPPRLLGHPGGAAATAVAWLPRELPAALVVGALQAGWLTYLSLRRGRTSWRPGLIAAVRRRRSRELLTAGETVTWAGCAIGLDARTGRLAGLSWAEAERCVLATAADPGELSTIALAVVCAAMRRRKTVLAFDFDGSRDAAALTGHVASLARVLGMPQSRAPRPGAAVAAAVASAIRARGVLLASGPGALLTGQVTEVLTWLQDRGLRGDSLLCLSGCEAVDPVLLAGLVALGPSTGTAMLATTTSTACAEALARHAGLTVACGPVSPDLAARLVSADVAAACAMSLDGDVLTRQRPGEFTIIGADRVWTGCQAVPIAAVGGQVHARPAPSRLALADVPTAAGSR